MLLVRQLDAGQSRLARGVALVEIVDLVVLAHLPRALDELVGDSTKRRELAGIDRVLDHQIAVLPIEFDLVPSQHVRPPLVCEREWRVRGARCLCKAKPGYVIDNTAGVKPRSPSRCSVVGSRRGETWG